ncbi:MAG: prepilin-type N-terminal cleavage/methylation domain-containing protein [Planctomycetota bacterium]
MNARTMKQRGLTLIELVVVLVVLTAVAGILLPKLPSMLTRTNTAVGATNIAELSKAIQLYEQTNFGYPQDFDSLVTTTSGGLFAALPGGNAAGDLVEVAITAENQQALDEAGIFSLMVMQDPDSSPPSDFSVTFNPYSSVSAPSTSVDQFDTLVGISDAALQDVLNAPPGKYVVFGVGKRCTLVGDTIDSAPTHFSDSTSNRADQTYARYGVVFQLEDALGPLERARIAAVIAIDDDGIQTADSFVENFYDLNSSSGQSSN